MTTRATLTSLIVALSLTPINAAPVGILPGKFLTFPLT
jgi:hypothetical protein